MIGLATGLAEGGAVPFAYSIATFALLRPYEFIRNGPVLHQLPVRIVGVGGVTEVPVGQPRRPPLLDGHEVGVAAVRFLGVALFEQHLRAAGQARDGRRRRCRRPLAPGHLRRGRRA
jgi:hypothetical protein